MGRQPEDSSGAKESVNIRLAPGHIRILDKVAARLGLNRSRTVARLLDKVEAGEQAKEQQ